MTDYVKRLDGWRGDGTLDRLDEALAQRTPIQIKRSSGDFVTGIICAFDHGGLSSAVAWADDLDGVTWDPVEYIVRFPVGVDCKWVDTVDLLEWNPELAGEQT